jgi:transposase-like protein
MDSCYLTCPYCHSQDKQVKNGYSQPGKPKFKCQSCQKTYYKDHKPYRGYSPETKLQAVKMYVDGMNFRRIARMLGVHHQSVINWINAYHQKQQDLNPNFPHENVASSAFATQPQDSRTQTSSLEVVEGDELFTFITHKKTVPM